MTDVCVATTGCRSLRAVCYRPSAVTLSTVGSRAFPVVGSQIWNDLPKHLLSRCLY